MKVESIALNMQLQNENNL